LDMGYSYGGGISSLYILSTVLHTEVWFLSNRGLKIQR
jgi:hypothetical protein